jgi:hypothetical protein
MGRKLGGLNFNKPSPNVTREVELAFAVWKDIGREQLLPLVLQIIVMASS